MPGTLFVVATPIGNLEDLSFRALRTLREVSLIAAEDTRRTAKLLAHYEIRRPLVSVREHTEAREAPKLITRMAAGESVALVSDAGTPGIADPGARLVRAAREAGIRVLPIPGPSAVAAALSASGFPADQFVFLGYPPASGSARRRWMEELDREHRTVVFFEAPHRIHRTLEECRALLADRPILVFREITKFNEESIEYHNTGDVRPQGEFVMTVGPLHTRPEPKVEISSDELLSDLFGYITEHHLGGSHVALRHLAKAFSLTERDVSKRIKKYRYSVKRPTRPTS